MKIRLLPEAESDIQKAVDFYESQLEGLGVYFYDSISSDIDSLAYFAGIHEQYRGFYRSLSKRFPFVIYYKISLSFVDIYAICDARQNPDTVEDVLRR